MHWAELLLELTLMPLVAFVVGLFMVLMMRKIGARIQRRIGPPFFQPLYDIVKLYGKQTQTSHGWMHDIGIVMAVGGYVAAEALLPVPGMNGIAEKGGLIVLTYMIMIPSLGLALGVGQCANPNGSIGISRALTAMLAYDIPFVIVVFGVAVNIHPTPSPTVSISRSTPASSPDKSVYAPVTQSRSSRKLKLPSSSKPS